MAREHRVRQRRSDLEVGAKTVASPARQQYLEIKRRHQDAILMFRLGDFYEMFDEDAETAARTLGIQLTARNYPRGEGRVPMAGVPFHAVQGYIKRLLDAGFRVAVCEQMTPPGKGIVERDVVRVFTPGTIVEGDMLEPGENNYLAAIARVKDRIGMAYVDVTTGEFVAAAVRTPSLLEAELLRIAPAECLIPTDLSEIGLPSTTRPSPPRDQMDSRRANRIFSDHMKAPPASFGLDEHKECLIAAATILDYLRGTNRAALDQIRAIRLTALDRYMVLDRYTRASLEILPSRGSAAGWSLLRVLDRTKTSMGARMLRSWLSQPLLDKTEIERRLDIIATVLRTPALIKTLEPKLASVGDIERVTARLVQRRAPASDMHLLRLSLEAVSDVKATVSTSDGLDLIAERIDPCGDIVGLIGAAIDPTQTAGIKDGFNVELDQTRSVGALARTEIAELERTEVEATGVKSLRIGYNKVFGYYFETGKSLAASLPERFIRQQTLLNAERFATPELKALEERIGTADERCRSLEAELFEQLIREVAAQHERIAESARTVAEIDVYRSLADVALTNNYCRPELRGDTDLQIVAGRHPVVEAANRDDPFVPNDCRFDLDQRIIILTGPNMGGKSTMLRTVALIVLMAQIGSYVPADQATIGIVDRIFSRVGAQDDIASGQSTFMTEMVETANILHNATSASLLILDEIGRGTSTYDGLAIARAVIEYIQSRVGARTLFATHYHELAELEAELVGVRNFHTEIAEHEGKVIFLHRITPGTADRSYGIHVARLAGLPHSVTVRADRILRKLENHANGRPAPGPQMALFADTDTVPRPEIEEAAVRILDAILSIDMENTTPIQAFEELRKLQIEGRTSR